MKYQIFLISFLILILFCGCENSQLVDSDFSYEEFIVVQSELAANEKFTGVVLTKTLPLGISYDIKNAEIKDAFAYLRKNFIQIIPLHYSENGIYKPLYELRPREEDVFELFAEIDENRIYAKTIIPKPPNISSSRYEPNSSQVIIDLIPDSSEVYGAIWQVYDPSPVKAENFFSIETMNYVGTKLNIRTQAIPEKYKDPNYLNNLYYQVFSFDRPFLDYFRSSNSSKVISNAFVQGGGNTLWNIAGQNVIGLFMGVNKSEIRKVQ